MSEKIAVAMSGGVDSSVVAAILKRDGYDVFGITMKLHDGPFNPENAKRIAKQLSIEHITLDLREEFAKYVIKDFCDSYTKGVTPNPCVVCNEYIKFGILLKEVIKSGAVKLATGHYARIQKKNSTYHLYKGVDSSKDQSYFLYRLGQRELKNILFPLGDMQKKEVYKIARLLGFPLTKESESQDICFIADGKSQQFIEQNTAYKPGNIVDKYNSVLGKHIGLPFYTVGQRRGIGISAEMPLYVNKIDCAGNKIVVGEEESLYSDNLMAEQINWVTGSSAEDGRWITAKIRYKSKETEAQMHYKGHGLNLKFTDSQRAITPGQSVVFYSGDEVLGGGIITAGAE